MNRILLYTLLAIFLIISGSYWVMVSSKSWSEILPLSEVQPPASEGIPADFESWVSYEDPDHLFKVKLPFLPQNAKDTVRMPGTNELRQYDMFVSEKPDGTIFMISLITFPSEVVKMEGESLLKTIMDGMVSSKPTNKIQSQNTGEFQGNPSLDFVITGDTISIETKSFLLNDTAYILSRLSTLENTNNNEFQYFINSFQLTEK